MNTFTEDNKRKEIKEKKMSMRKKSKEKGL